ncbi:MAG: hypothetical protein HY748_13075 [Elusimicrobia bacterium]|nr:hypothetical protein [Elusimicrobiota bacterium]
MLELILLASLNAANPATAQVQPCVWPNLCASQPAAVAQADVKPEPKAKDYETCVWPNRCS